MSGVITTNGLNILMDRFLTSSTYSKPSRFKIGYGTTDPTTSDTDIESPYPISGTESVDDCDTADWSDSADMTSAVNSSTFKEGTGALNLTKDGTASANASLSKATTSRDFTSKELHIWLYIKDATALTKLATSSCLTLRFGSDSSNYYQWVLDKADLSTGWNYLKFLIGDATTVSSPTISACDYTFLQLTATGSVIVWSAGDFIMDDIRVVSSGDYFKNLESSVIDETNKRIKHIMTLNAVEGNGVLITEVGIFNSDSTPVMWSRDELGSAISKTDSEEIRITQTDEFVVIEEA